MVSPPTAAATAPAGSVAAARKVVINGLAAGGTALAPHGAISVNNGIPGQPAVEVASAPNGSVDAVRNVTVAGLRIRPPYAADCVQCLELLRAEADAPHCLEWFRTTTTAPDLD